jgi:hypothetical protein
MNPNLAQVKSPGRKGIPNKATRQAREFAQMIISSPAYQSSLVARIRSGTLPPAIEQMLWHYAFGKPKEHITIEDLRSGEDLEALSTSDIARRAEILAERVRRGDFVVLNRPEPLLLNIAEQLSTPVDPDDMPSPNLEEKAS